MFTFLKVCSWCLGDSICIYRLASKTFLFETLNINVKGLFDFTD